MQRRELLAKGALTVGAATGLAGCFGLFGGSPAPPRDSHVFEPLQVQGQELVVEFEDDLWLKSRADVDSGRLRPAQAGLLGGIDLAEYSPVGLASAAKGASGRGTGGYFAAPKDRHGRAVLFGDDDDDEWYSNHADDVRRFSVVPVALGLAYLGSEAQFTDNPPAPGQVPWDRTMGDPQGRATLPLNRGPGWYRVAAELTAANANYNFGWESIDFEADRSAGDMELEEQWKVSPRI